jgi:hypothetical protein
MNFQYFSGIIANALVPFLTSGVLGVEDSTDCDIDLCWVHGYRTSDSRNNLFYSAAGSIVYTAAAVAIVYNKGKRTRQSISE